MDYIQFFNDGWTVIAAAPIQFVLILVLTLIGVWLVLYRSFRHSLKMEKHLKETYKEKYEISEKDRLDSDERARKLERESREYKTQQDETIRKLTNEVKRLNDSVATLQFNVSAISVEREGTNKVLESKLNKLAQADIIYSSLKSEHYSFLNQHGRWRITQLGMNCVPSLSKVAIHYSEKDDDGLAETIRRFFWSEFGTPWISEEPKKVEWFKNPSHKARIVIFSNHPFADGMRESFNECKLIRIKDDNGSDRYRYEKIDLRDKRPEMTADITIMIFDKAGKLEL